MSKLVIQKTTAGVVWIEALARAQDEPQQGGVESADVEDRNAPKRFGNNRKKVPKSLSKRRKKLAKASARINRKN